MRFWKQSETEALRRRVAVLEGECAELKEKNRNLGKSYYEVKEQYDKVAAFVRQQNDADLYWAARKVIENVDKPASEPLRLDAMGLMQNAMAAQQQHRLLGPSLLQHLGLGAGFRYFP